MLLEKKIPNSTMLIHQSIEKYIIESEKKFEEVINESHQVKMLFDFDDESFFEWLAINEKKGLCLNHYREQRKLLEWSFYSLIHADSHLKIFETTKESDFKFWGRSMGMISMVEYYVDNSIFRIHSTLERVYSFCDIWFELGLSKEDGRLFNTDRMFKEEFINNHPNWKASKILTNLTKIRSKYKNEIEDLRHNLTHNFDPREVKVEYDKVNLHISIPSPTFKTDEKLISKIKELLRELYFLRTLEADELSKDMESNKVRIITMNDMEYFTMRDSPLF